MRKQIFWLKLTTILLLLLVFKDSSSLAAAAIGSLPNVGPFCTAVVVLGTVIYAVLGMAVCSSIMKDIDREFTQKEGKHGSISNYAKYDAGTDKTDAGRTDH